MKPMNTFVVIAVFGGVVFGFVLGVVVLSVFQWRGRRHLQTPTSLLVIPQSDEHIDAVAEAWARANGVPAAAPLVARKLRLFQSVEARRAARRWWP
jgi:hypothetical protein